MYNCPVKGEEFREDTRIRKTLPPAIVKELSHQNDVRAWASVASLLVVIGVCIGASLIWWTPWVVLPSIIIIASRQQACFVLAHDAAHYRLFKNRFTNDLIGRMLAAPVGIPMRSYRVVHRLHHNHLYQSQDPDIPIHGGYPRGRRYLLRKLLIDLTGRTAPKTFAYFLGAPTTINKEIDGADQLLQSKLTDTTPKLRKAAQRDGFWTIAFHLCALALTSINGYGLFYLVIWVLPLCTVLQALLRFRSICEHGAVKNKQSPLLAARTNLGPAWLMWFLFPYQVNYHIEHHLHPSIPHYNLPACHKEMMQKGLLKTAEVRHIFTTAGIVSANVVATN